MKKVSIYIILLSATVFATSCEKHFLDVNTNPNNPSQADPALVLTNALTQTGAIISSDYLYINGTQNYYGSSSNAATPGPVTTNNFTSNDFANSWGDNYHNLNDYAYIAQQGALANKWLLVGIARTMTALGFQMLVDSYNDVPYSQALQLDSGIINPVYDKAQDIYNSCIQQLDTAVSIFENAPLIEGYNPGNADVMFQGNATLWAQFANTVKLRMLLHEINVSSQLTTIQAEMQKIANDPVGLLGAGQSALVNPGYATDIAAHLSPLWVSVGYNINGAANFIGAVANSYFINKLNSYNDPRVGYFYNTNSAGLVEGAALGGQGGNSSACYFGGPLNLENSNNIPFNDTLPAGVAAPANFGLLQGPTMSSIILSSWESLFLQAEAVQRGLLPGNAQALYNQAIIDNFAYLKVTFGPSNAYNASPVAYAQSYEAQNIANVGWSASTGNPLQAILTQKYISLCFTDPLESWTDYRRTGFPSDLPFSDNPERLYNYPFRFIYPQSEYNTNAANVGAEGTISPVSPKIFWMP
jgi:Starch-binding associating with outer membrane